MAVEVDFKSMVPPGSKSNSNKTQYLDFPNGKGKVFRPIGGAMSFYKIFLRTPQGNRSIVVNPADKDKAAAVISAKFGQEVQPKLRYAINVIDREDNTIKVLEGGPSIFNHFAAWSQANGGTPPGGMNGFDWSVMSHGDGMNKKYTVTALRPAPLTQDELTRVKNTENLYSIKKLYEGVEPNAILDKLAGNKKGSSDEGPEPTMTTAGDVVSSSDDPANW